MYLYTVYIYYYIYYIYIIYFIMKQLLLIAQSKKVLNCDTTSFFTFTCFCFQVKNLKNT